MTPLKTYTLRSFLPLFAALALLLFPAAAQAGYQDVIDDCQDHGEQLTKTYTAREYQQALDNLPTDVREYSGCEDTIRAAMLNVASGGSGIGVGGGGGFGGVGGFGGGSANAAGGDGPPPLASASPAEQQAAADAEQIGDQSVIVGEEPVTPGDPGSAFSSLGDLPAPLMVVLVLTVLAMAAGLTLFITRRAAA
jgi:hypothetical protein